MKYFAIIVGGGSGKRMETTLPKQFLLLHHKPILMHTIEKFFNCAYQPQIILVLHPDVHAYWIDLCKTYNFTIPYTLVAGGEQRFHSVRNGLMHIKADGLIAIHDAVRPLVSTALITQIFDAAEKNGNAIPCIKPAESVRKVNKTNSEIINREQIVLIQTPQVFESKQLKLAYQQPFDKLFTDDASVVEKTKVKINLVAGERQNLKITYPEDLAIAKLFC